MNHLEEMRMKLQNRIMLHCDSRAYGLSVMQQIDQYVEDCVRVALSDAACEVAKETGIG